MKKVLSLVLVGILLLSSMHIFAQNGSGDLPDVLKTVNTRYADAITKAIETSEYEATELDKDNIYIVEKNTVSQYRNGDDISEYYVAIPLVGSEDISYGIFRNGVYYKAVRNPASMLHVENYMNTKVEQYIAENHLTNVTEAVVTIFYGRTRMETYRIVTEDETYFIPYYCEREYNLANDENCALEFGKAYKAMDFIERLEREEVSFEAYNEAQKKAEEERLAAEARKEEEKYRPIIALDENGDEIIKVNGMNLDDILDELTESIKLMGFASTINMGINTSDENCLVTYRWKKGCDVNAVVDFAEGLFDELKTQAATGKPGSPQNVSYCNFNLKHDEGYTSVRHHVGIRIWDDGVSITVNHGDAIECKVKDSAAIIRYLNRYSDCSFDGFQYEMNDENTPHIRGNLDGLAKTDIIEFSFTLPARTDNDISKEVATSGSVVNGTFERYKENKYKSTYILTLSGDLGTISFCTEEQSSLSGEEEIFSNNIPVSFLNTMRFEDGNIVEYKVGKESSSYKLKMVFRSKDISEVRFEDIKCTDLTYTQLTEDTKLSNEYIEKNKEVVIKEAKECADTLYDLGLFKGTDQGYELEKSLTREESVTIVVRLLGEADKVNADDFDATFVDVGKERWSYAYVMYCYENGITKGTGEDTFTPDAQIDASQFITLLMRLLGYTEVNPDTAMVKSIEHRLLPAEKVEELIQKSIFTRSDMVQIVYNSLKTQMENEVVFSEYLMDKGILSENQIQQIR